eukprot:CAMPEP_0179189558 /NCGR_PEP_ID=MMETSP0796-20121207/94103_1 /TAXON_ID=73915 /ORGANISM="Pyrodinium bahamense, Strain pbaha01" /LENGTH=103 /DNA_ID=CAMNT_0020893695 /DNA_START=178 /DNA_END=487 /DNA_ORIENTATION=+
MARARVFTFARVVPARWQYDAQTLRQQEQMWLTPVSRAWCWVWVVAKPLRVWLADKEFLARNHSDEAFARLGSRGTAPTYEVAEAESGEAGMFGAAGEGGAGK